MSLTISEIPIIDTDTHVVEPPDLWTSRMSSKWGDLVPHVEWDEAAEEEAWFTGEQRLGAVGAPAMAGWHEHPPFHPRRFADTDPASWDATRRAAVMDDYGVQAQVLYPNVAVFDAKSIVGMDDTELQLACIEAYNDFLVDFGSEQPGRFVAGRGAAVLGPRRDAGRDRAVRRPWATRGIVFTQDPSYFGLPQLTDRLLGSDVGLGAGEGAAGQLPHRLGRPRPVQRRPPRQRRRTPTTRRWACRSSWPTPARSPS